MQVTASSGRLDAPHASPALFKPARCQRRKLAKTVAMSKPVADAPTVNTVPKPITSVLQDLTPFEGLPSLGS